MLKQYLTCREPLELEGDGMRSWQLASSPTATFYVTNKPKKMHLSQSLEGYLYKE